MLAESAEVIPGGGTSQEKGLPSTKATALWLISQFIVAKMAEISSGSSMGQESPLTQKDRTPFAAAKPAQEKVSQPGNPRPINSHNSKRGGRMQRIKQNCWT